MIWGMMGSAGDEDVDEEPGSTAAVAARPNGQQTATPVVAPRSRVEPI